MNCLQIYRVVGVTECTQRAHVHAWRGGIVMSSGFYASSTGQPVSIHYPDLGWRCFMGRLAVCQPFSLSDNACREDFILPAWLLT